MSSDNLTCHRLRYIPVPTGNSADSNTWCIIFAVYPCTYRELCCCTNDICCSVGISLYLQGTHGVAVLPEPLARYIPVPTGNSLKILHKSPRLPVYPCTYRELWRMVFKRFTVCGISLYLQGTLPVSVVIFFYRRYIPVPTGNSFNVWHSNT